MSKQTRLITIDKETLNTNLNLRDTKVTDMSIWYIEIFSKHFYRPKFAMAKVLVDFGSLFAGVLAGTWVGKYGPDVLDIIMDMRSIEKNIDLKQKPFGHVAEYKEEKYLDNNNLSQNDSD